MVTVPTPLGAVCSSVFTLSGIALWMRNRLLETECGFRITVWESFKSISATHTRPPPLFPGKDWIGLLGVG